MNEPEPAADVALDTPPPHSIEAEQSVLGAMLLNADAWAKALAILKPSDFYDPAHGRLFAFLADVVMAREDGEKPLDIVLLREALTAAGKLEEVGGVEYLVTLADAVPTVANVEYYARIVREKAAQREAVQAGFELARQAGQPQADVPALLASAQDGLKRLAGRIKPAAPKSLRQQMAEYPEMRPPVIHGLARQSETINMIAPTKTGKSWQAAALALNVATGRAFLGLYPCERGDVLILDNELHGETIANRIPRVAAALGIPLADVADHVFIENLRGRLMDIYGLRDYLADVQPGRYKIIVLDAFYRFLPRDADENSNADISSMYNILDAIADRLGCSFVLIHHSSKGSQTGKSITDVGSGAGAQSRASDTHLILRAHEQDNCFVLDAAARSWPPIKPICLRWEFPVFRPAPDLDPAALKPDRPRRIRPPKEPAPPVKAWNTAGFVEDFLTDKPKPRAAIVESARAQGLSENRAKGLLSAAVGEGIAFCWRFGPTAPMQFATTKQPGLEGTTR